MPEKSLEELARWAKEYPSHPNPAPFVTHIRNLPEPREAWKWLQDLLLDEKNTTADISNLLHSDKPWSCLYGSPVSIKCHLQTIRSKFLDFRFNVSYRKLMKPRPSPEFLTQPFVKPTELKVFLAPKPTTKPDLSVKIRMVLDLGLSPDTLVLVLKDLI